MAWRFLVLSFLSLWPRHTSNDCRTLASTWISFRNIIPVIESSFHAWFHLKNFACTMSYQTLIGRNWKLSKSGKGTAQSKL